VYHLATTHFVQTDRQTDHTIMPIASHTAYRYSSTIS